MISEISNQTIEANILGECLRNNRSIDKILSYGVSKDDFYSTKHRDIFESIVNTYKKYSTVDVVLVAGDNKNLSISYLAELFSSSLSINIKSYVKMLKEYSSNRKYIEIANALQNGKVEDCSLIIRKVVEDEEELNRKLNSDNTIITLDRVKTININKAEKIKTGFKGIDDKILGFMMGSLNVITGYNGSGKSTIINQMCIAESLSQGYKVFAYSPELTNSNLKSWLYPTLAINDHFVSREYNGVKYKKVGNIGIKVIDGWIKDKLYIYSDDSMTSSPNQLLNDMEYLFNNKGVRVFIIDNLMKLDLENGYKDRYVGQKHFTNALKEFARKYNVLIHLVAHPKKPQELNKPKLDKFDISGSADISNLADYVMGIVRVSDSMRKEAWEKDKIDLKDCIIKFLKDRPSGSNEFNIILSFDKTRRRFYNIEKELEKDYGYTRKLDMVQVENEINLFNIGGSKNE